MKQIVLIINEEQIGIAKALLEENRINFREAGYPDGKVRVIESYPSKINIHSEMTEYAKSEGYKDVTDAISKIGSAVAFKRYFNEHKSMQNG